MTHAPFSSAEPRKQIPFSKFLSEQQGLGNVNLKLHEMRVGLVHG
jgi:hypothetical protein